jgi:hypothetical protein
MNILIPFDEIVADRELQARSDYDIENPSDIAEAIKQGSSIPRIKVMAVADRGGAKYVVDGFDRLAAHRLADKKMVPCVMLQGTWQDARDMATAANAEHTARKRSPQDKRRAARMCLEDHPDWSDPKVANHCKVSVDLVKTVRQLIPKPEKAETPKERVGMDGKVRPMPKAPPRPKLAEVKTTPVPRSLFDWPKLAEEARRVKNGIDALKSLTGDEKGAIAAQEWINRALAWAEASWKAVSTTSKGERNGEEKAAG